MGARKPKPVQLKERTTNRSLADLSDLFASANEVVTLNPETRKTSAPKYVSNIQGAPSNSFPSTPDLDDKTVKIGASCAPAPEPRGDRSHISHPTSSPASSQRTVIKSSSDDLTVTRASSVKPLPPYNPAAEAAKEQAVAQARLDAIRAKQSSADQRKSLALVMAFFLAALGLIGYATVSPSPKTDISAGASSQLTQSQIEERLQYHRQFTGSRLNRERIDVQLQNHIEAPELSTDARKMRAPSMMDGVPLVGEENRYKRQADWPVNPSHPDAKIMYGLQEEQDRIYFETAARKAWVKEFVENARKDGVKLEIDKFGNVKTSNLPGGPTNLEPEEIGLNPYSSTDTILER